MQVPPTPIEWVWDGYIRPKSITLMTGQWKAGKTTLLANLLGRLGSGGALAGRSVRKGTAVVLSEEGPGLWLPRLELFGIGDEVSFGFEFNTRHPTDSDGWYKLLTDLLHRYAEWPIDLLVLDTVGTIMPTGAEGNAGMMTTLLRPLRELCWFGVSVLLMHHPSKGSPGFGQKARGTGALPAGVDVVLEFDWAGPRTPENRRRVLWGWSRHASTPPRTHLELNPDGKDYTVLADPVSADPDANWVRVLTDLLAGPESRTMREVRAAWPVGESLPSERTLIRRLTDLVDGGWLTRTGRGDRFDPYRYRAV